MRSRFGIFALVVAFPLVACGGDDGVGLSGDTLTEDEAAALAEYVVGQGLEQGFEGYQTEGTAQAPARVPFTYEESFSTTAPCPEGGSLAVSASFTATGDTEVEGDITLDFSLTQTHDDCAVVPESTDVQFTLNGAPNVSLDFVIEVTNGEEVEAGGDLGGALSWATDDGRTGTCPVDMDYALDVNLTTEVGTATLDGTICGVTLSRTIDMGGQAI